MNARITLFSKVKKASYCQLKRLRSSLNQTPAEYCLDLVRKNDYENFVSTLFLPHNLRSPALAIRAFNTEIALVEDQVRDSKIGLMRLKFWEEALNEIYNNKPPQNPVSLELHRNLKKYKLSKHYFKRLVESRFNKLNTSIFTDLESLEKYAENTVSSIYYLILEAQGTKDVNTDHFASHFGKAHGIVNLVRSVPHNAQKRNVILPQSILMKYNVSSEAIFQRKNDTALKDVIFEIASTAKQHLNKALLLKSQIKKESRVIFLSSFIIERYLENLQRLDFDVFNSQLQRRNSLLPIKLAWSKLFI